MTSTQDLCTEYTVAAVPKLVHLALYRLGCPPPAKALCGARVSEHANASGPDCVVCAEILRSIESGVGD